MVLDVALVARTVAFHSDADSQIPPNLYKIIPRMKRISILGSTGSIGRQCLQRCGFAPGRFEVVALAAGANVALVAEQISRGIIPKLFPSPPKTPHASSAPPFIASGTTNQSKFCSGRGNRTRRHSSRRGTVVSAAVGVVGLPATYKAIEHGKDIALANKEVLVAAGEVVMAAVARHGVALLPGR